MNKQIVSSAEPAKSDGELIYVVDDEPMLLELATVILAPLGYAIKTFRDPDAAVREFTSTQVYPALIITDYAMNGMNGIELIEACRRIRPEQKALVLSGTVAPDFFFNAPIKPDRFLGKPYQAKQLIDLVKLMLSR